MIDGLFGDGINDDTDGIQRLLDGRACRVELPPPAECYLISRTLKIHSNQELVLPRFCRIRLREGSNCTMLENADPEAGNTNIDISGGIWDFNNRGQLGNPFAVPHKDRPDYMGFMMLFRKVKNFRLSNLTFKDTVTFAVTLDTVIDFTVENITFDFNYGNPYATNMDGIHLNGNCYYGVIRNLKGACYDDLVALNADEGSAGPISHISIDGIFATDCHSAVRLLADRCPVTDVHIQNVFGTYYVYCITLSKYYNAAERGSFDRIVLNNIHAAKAANNPVYQKPDAFQRSLPIIYVESNLRVNNLHIYDVHRVEENIPIETIRVDPETIVDNLTIANVSVENRIGQPMPLLVNCGEIGRLHTSMLEAGEDVVFDNRGTVREHIKN
jgi:Glycosyl hydrolases family 28